MPKPSVRNPLSPDEVLKLRRCMAAVDAARKLPPETPIGSEFWAKIDAIPQDQLPDPETWK